MVGKTTLILLYSNTTLVKVKWKIRCFKSWCYIIQIQHLLKLNFPYRNERLAVGYIQIQHLLKLNMPAVLVETAFISKFKYNTC